MLGRHVADDSYHDFWLLLPVFPVKLWPLLCPCLCLPRYLVNTGAPSAQLLRPCNIPAASAIVVVLLDVERRIMPYMLYHYVIITVVVVDCQDY